MSFLTTTPRALRAFIVGESYWTVRLKSGRVLSELDTRTVTLDTLLDQEQIQQWNFLKRDLTKPMTLGTKQIRVRNVEWLEDLISSGDLGNVTEIQLHTPKGVAHMTVTEPYTAFQFSRGTMAMLTGERIKNFQLAGVVTDKTTGECECAIWDQHTQELYTMHNNVLNFTKWREGMIDIGRLNIEALDLRGLG